MNGMVLKLNRSYLPIEIIPWTDAITLWVNDKVEIITSYKDKILHSGLGNKYIESKYNAKLDTWEQAMNMPAVVRCFEFVKPHGLFRVFKPYTRRNIWERDKGICQYCGGKVSFSKFQIEHVMPQSRGGKSNWKNIVCSCPNCNSKKRNRTPEEADVTLIRKPYAPIIANSYNESILKKFRSMKKMMNIDEWRSWIYWNCELESEE